MISSTDLQKCLQILANITNGADYATRQQAVEIGYILKKELDIVTAIEQRNASNSLGRQIDMQGLINDNVQLFHENNKLLQENMSLKNILESRVNAIAQKMTEVCGDVSRVNHVIESLG